jgi:hypothetical protein
VNSKIQEVLRYSSDNDLSIELQNHEGKVISIEELVDQFYGSPDEYFERGDLDKNEMANKTYQKQLQKDVPQPGLLEEHVEKAEITNESQETKQDTVESLQSSEDPSKNIFHLPERNNFLYRCLQKKQFISIKVLYL